VADVGWEDYRRDSYISPGLNEVNVASSLEDVCGIVLNKNAKSISTTDVTFQDSLLAAMELKQYLIRTYPAVFDESLPIMCYETNKSVDLTPLDQEKIQEILKAAPQHGTPSRGRF